MCIVFSSFTRLSLFTIENIEVLEIIIPAPRLSDYFGSFCSSTGHPSWHSLTVAGIVLLGAVSCSEEALSLPLLSLDCIAPTLPVLSWHIAGFLPCRSVITSQCIVQVCLSMCAFLFLCLSLLEFEELQEKNLCFIFCYIPRTEKNVQHIVSLN